MTDKTTPTVGFVSLGCPKALVDSERILTQLRLDGYDIVPNYDNADMREEMIQSLEFWLREADIDGYRCDVAEMVPLDFWVDARARIDSVKPSFFLAEGEAAELHEAFDMTYAWSFHHLMNEVSRGEKGASDVKAYWDEQSSKYKSEDYRMQFITNHR